MSPQPPTTTPFPYTTLFRSPPTSIPAVLDPKVFKAYDVRGIYPDELDEAGAYAIGRAYVDEFEPRAIAVGRDIDRKSTRLNSSHVKISYAVFCLKKKKKKIY